MSDEPQVLRPAATVVVVRDAPSADGDPVIETLMLRRNDRGAFGGMWVFPGGRVDEGDTDPAHPGDEIAAGRRAAVREAFEEAAIVLDPDAMVPLSHWQPPSSVPKGFATWFFVAAGTEGDVQVDGSEIHEHAWLPAVEVLRRQQVGEVTLAPPTFVTLRLLAEHATVAGLLDALRGATPERFHTQIGRVDGVNAAIWHGDEVYTALPGSAGELHRLTMADGEWRYVRSTTDPSITR
jgi:8-oxo-dGTP pyrophosphatase MutT (NUDIX family)